MKYITILVFIISMSIVPVYADDCKPCTTCAKGIMKFVFSDFGEYAAELGALEAEAEANRALADIKQAELNKIIKERKQREKEKNTNSTDEFVDWIKNMINKLSEIKSTEVEAEDKGQRTEVEAEDKGQRTEVEAEDKGQKTEDTKEQPKSIIDKNRQPITLDELKLIIYGTLFEVADKLDNLISKEK